MQAPKVAASIATPVAEATPPAKTVAQEPPKPSPAKSPAPPTSTVSGRSSVADFSIANLMNSANEDIETKEKPKEEVKEQSAFEEAKALLDEGGLDKEFKEMAQLELSENAEIIEKVQEELCALETAQKSFAKTTLTKRLAFCAWTARNPTLSNITN